MEKRPINARFTIKVTYPKGHPDGSKYIEVVKKYYAVTNDEADKLTTSYRNQGLEALKFKKR